MVLRLYFSTLETWVAWSVLFPSFSSWFIRTHTNVGPPAPPASALPEVLSAWPPVSAPSTGLDECFFFDSLVVGLPYSSIFLQFWLLFLLFLNLLLSFFWLCEEAQCIYLCPHLGQKSLIVGFLILTQGYVFIDFRERERKVEKREKEKPM